MKTKHQLIGLCLSSVFVLVIVVSSAPCALAVEGGLGRPISGMQIAPYAGFPAVWEALVLVDAIYNPKIED